MRKAPGRGPFFAAFCALIAAGWPSSSSAVALDNGAALSIQNEFLYYHNRITGSNRAGSFLTPGDFATENLGLRYEVKRKESAWETAADGRMADDGRVEAKRFNLKRFYTKYADAGTDAVVGDYLASFTPYSLNTSLKGGRYTYRWSDTLDVRLLTGIPKVNWDDLWNHNAAETVDRKYYGARAAKRFAGEAAVGASVVWSKDSRAHFNTAAVRQDQRVFALDWALPMLHRLWVRGESAFSKTENDNPTTAASSQKGWAHLVKADYSRGRFKTQNDFERVSPEYAATGGLASPDLIRLRTQNQWRLQGPWRLAFGYAWFHNNLNGAVGTTSTTRLPEFGLRYDGPDWRPSFSAASKLRHREVTSSGTGLRNRTRSIASSVSDRLGPVNATLDYEFQHQDKSDGTQSGRHHILGLGLSSLHPLRSGFKLMPSVRWNLQRDRDNLVGKADQTNLLTANMVVESPWGADAGMGYSRNLVLNAVNPGADRRSLTASLGYDILRHAERRAELRFRQNDNRFTTAGQDFKETVWELAFNVRF